MSYTVEEVCQAAMELAGRGDKPSNEDLNKAVKILGSILADWSVTRDVQLWNLVDSELDVPVCDWVTNDGVTYKCYRDHTADADNEPGKGDNWADYWVAASEDTYSPTPAEWTSGFEYAANKTYALDPMTDEDILAVKVQHAGQITYVDKISALEYQKLPIDSFGLPEMVWVEKALEGAVVHLWPICDCEDAKLLYYLVRRPGEPDKAATLTMPDQWIPALYYALAVELGFLWSISYERINLLGQKAKFEFDKALRTNTSEVSSCIVKPCY